MNGSLMGDLTVSTTKTWNTTEPASETMTSTDTTKNELDIEVVNDEPYPWTQSDDEKRKRFVFEYFNWNPDIHVDAQIQQLERINKWLKQ